MTTPALPECITGPRLIALLDPRPTGTIDGVEPPNDDARLGTLVTIIEIMTQEGMRTFSLAVGPEGAGADDLALLGELREIFTERASFGLHGYSSVNQLDRVLSAAPEFVLASHDDHDLVRAAQGGGALVIPAGLTPNEIRGAWSLDVAAVQVMPADLMASSYPATLQELLPEVPLIARGGLGAWSVGRWFEGQAVACCTDTTLIGDAMAPGANLGQFRDRCRSYLDVVPAADDQA